MATSTWGAVAHVLTERDSLFPEATDADVVGALEILCSIGWDPTPDAADLLWRVLQEIRGILQPYSHLSAVRAVLERI